MGEAVACSRRADKAREMGDRDVFIVTAAETEMTRETRSDDLWSASHGQCNAMDLG